jgi:carboxypeptidase Taq
MSAAYAELIEHLRAVAALNSVASLLGWDQETMMPRKGADARAEQLALVARLAHDRATAPRIGELLATCECDESLVADPAVSANLREIRRDYDRARRLPADLVAELQEAASRSLEAWKAARQASDFAAFEPWLRRLLDLCRRKADCYEVPRGGEAYDTLLDEYEEGTTCAELESIFGPLRDELAPLIAETTAAEPRGGRAARRLRFPVERQRALNSFVLERLGFDLEAGRFDVSVHPFSSGIGPGDARITTRYREDDFPEALGSTIHEAGHGMYEQGLPRSTHWGQPLGEPLGLGIHESQSRLWENHVGRSLSFWRWLLPRARHFLGRELAGFSPEDLHAEVNLVRPNPIRVESDEATYSLHVMLRFDLERALFRGDLDPRDLPGAWNDRIREDLGIEVRDDAQGCLQDIHWSMGAIGYFPTYTLGSLYAAQFWEALSRDVGRVDEHVERGEFAPILEWLRQRIHRHGRRYPAKELCRMLTGEALGHRPLMRHLRAKLAPIYGLESGAA